MKAKNQFVSNHPKFAAFFRNVLTGGVQEGTVIEITVTRPGGGTDDDKYACTAV